MLRWVVTEVIFLPLEILVWADEILKAEVGNIAVDLAAAFEIAQINQLSRQQTGIVKGKS